MPCGIGRQENIPGARPEVSSCWGLRSNARETIRPHGQSGTDGELDGEVDGDAGERRRCC